MIDASFFDIFFHFFFFASFQSCTSWLIVQGFVDLLLALNFLKVDCCFDIIGSQVASQELARKDSDVLSCSTASSRRLSLASTATSSTFESSWSERRSLNAPKGIERVERVELLDGFTTCLCPRCLQAMPLRWERPAEEIYCEGVRCDHCKKEIMKDVGPANHSFCHCSSCSFDLCRACAYKEMQMWWGET